MRDTRLKIKKKKRNIRFYFYRILIIFIIIFIVIFIISYLGGRNKIPGKTGINGIDVSGLTREEAEKRLSSVVKKAMGKTIYLQYKDWKFSINPSDLSPKPDINEAVDKAKGMKDKRSFWDNFSIFRKERIFWINCRVNEVALRQFVNDISDKIDEPKQDATLKIEGRTLKKISSKKGLKVEKETLYSLISQRIADPNRGILQLPVSILEPITIESDLDLAIQQVKMITFASLVIKYGKSKISLTPNEVASLIEFIPAKKIDRKSKNSQNLLATISLGKIDDVLSTLKEKYNIDAKDARFEANGEDIAIIPSTEGKILNIEGAMPEIRGEVFSFPPREVTLQLTTAYPNITTEKAKSMGIKERISTYTDNFGYDPSRSHNVITFAQAINDTIIPPDGAFSLNETTGPRTKEKGYLTAPIIIGNQLVPGLGGGNCQVGTAVFNAAFFAGYPILERQNHSFYISHYPLGRDATVDYGNIDVKFKNDTPYYAILKTWASNTSLTVSIYSTYMNRKVTFNNSGMYDAVPFSTQYIDDPDLKEGEEKEEKDGYGINGFKVDVVRTVYQNDEKIREDKFHSEYYPKTRVVRKGTKKEATETPKTTSFLMYLDKIIFGSERSLDRS